MVTDIDWNDFAFDQQKLHRDAVGQVDRDGVQAVVLAAQAMQAQ